MSSIVTYRMETSVMSVTDHQEDTNREFKLANIRPVIKQMIVYLVKMLVKYSKL